MSELGQKGFSLSGSSATCESIWYSEHVGTPEYRSNCQTRRYLWQQRYQLSSELSETAGVWLEEALINASNDGLAYLVLSNTNGVSCQSS